MKMILSHKITRAIISVLVLGALVIGSNALYAEFTGPTGTPGAQQGNVPVQPEPNSVIRFSLSFIAEIRLSYIPENRPIECLKCGDVIKNFVALVLVKAVT